MTACDAEAAGSAIFSMDAHMMYLDALADVGHADCEFFVSGEPACFYQNTLFSSLNSRVARGNKFILWKRPIKGVEPPTTMNDIIDTMHREVPLLRGK